MKIVPARPRASSPRVCTLPCAAARWLVHTAVRRRVPEAALAGGLPPLLAPRFALALPSAVPARPTVSGHTEFALYGNPTGCSIALSRLSQLQPCNCELCVAHLSKKGTLYDGVQDELFIFFTKYAAKARELINFVTVRCTTYDVKASELINIAHMPVRRTTRKPAN